MKPRSLAGRLFVYFGVASLLFGAVLVYLTRLHLGDLLLLEKTQVSAAFEELLLLDEQGPVQQDQLEQVCRRYQVSLNPAGEEMLLPHYGPIRLRPLRRTSLFLLHEARSNVLGLTAAWLGVIVVASVLTAAYAQDLLRRLRQGARQFGLNLPVDGANRDEIGEAVEAFEALATRLAQRQQQLQEHIAQLQRDNDFRARLVSRVASELAPAVQQLREIAQSSSDQGLEVMRRNAQAMETILSDLRDAGQLESDRLRLCLQTLDLRQPVRGALERVQAQSGVSFAVDLPEEPVWVEGDPDRLEQVILNLLSNAIKFAPPGSTISIQVDSYRITVSDEGPGMSPELMTGLGREFHQGEGERGRRGTGLGLAISRRLVELHGGQITAEARGEERGTAVRVTLPSPKRESQ